jgi:hypothetical protein
MAGLFDPSSIYFQLVQAGLLPQWAQQRPFTGADGSYNPDRNKMVAAAPSNPFSKTTLSHELTHAAQFNLLYPAFNKINEKLKQGVKISSEEAQYFEATKKLMAEQPFGKYSVKEDKTNKDSLKKAVDALYKDTSGDSSYKTYRTQPIELQAFGVGNMTQGGMHASTKKELMGSNYSPHLDPSFTSEFDIIMSLYNKLPTEIKQESIAKRKEDIKSNNKFLGTDKNDTYYKYENIFEDPFKSSVK